MYVGAKFYHMNSKLALNRQCSLDFDQTSHNEQIRSYIIISNTHKR